MEGTSRQRIGQLLQSQQEGGGCRLQAVEYSAGSPHQSMSMSYLTSAGMTCREVYMLALMTVGPGQLVGRQQSDVLWLVADASGASRPQR